MNEDIDKIVNDLKARGVFDEFRRECFSIIDTRPAFEGLRQRLDIITKTFFDEETWTPNANKNQLREKLRKKVTQSDNIKNNINSLVNQVVDPTYMLSSIDKHVQDYLGIKVEEPLVRSEDNNVIAWPENEMIEVKKEDSNKWGQGNEINKSDARSVNPSLSPSTVSSHSLSPPTPEPITDGATEDSFPAAPSPTSLISGENSKSSQHYFDESTSKSPENKTKNDIWNQLSKEGKQSADEPKPEPLDWGTNTLPPPERPFAHLGSSAGQPTVEETTTEDAPTIKSEPKSPELPSSSSSVPLTSSKSKEESREEISEVEESKGKSEPIVSGLLSDVSSAHTSDLSDFDDAMSISSIEEAEDIIKGVEITEPKVIQSEEKFQETRKENDPIPCANEVIKTIKVEDAGQVKVLEQLSKENVVKDQAKDKSEDQVKDQVNDPTKDQNVDQVMEPVEEEIKKQSESQKRKEPEKESDHWDVEMHEVKPKFEIFKSTPEAPVFDIRARGKDATCLAQSRSGNFTKTSEIIPSPVKVDSKPSESAKGKFVIPRIKREPKSRDSSPPTSRPTTPSTGTSHSTSTPSSPTANTPSGSSRLTIDESRGKRSSRESNSKKKSDLSSSQRYDEADLYKPRYSIPGGSRRHRSSNVK